MWRIIATKSTPTKHCSRHTSRQNGGYIDNTKPETFLFRSEGTPFSEDKTIWNLQNVLKNEKKSEREREFQPSSSVPVSHIKPVYLKNPLQSHPYRHSMVLECSTNPLLTISWKTTEVTEVLSPLTLSEHPLPRPLMPPLSSAKHRIHTFIFALQYIRFLYRLVWLYLCDKEKGFYKTTCHICQM